MPTGFQVTCSLNCTGSKSFSKVKHSFIEINKRTMFSKKKGSYTSQTSVSITPWFALHSSTFQIPSTFCIGECVHLLTTIATFYVKLEVTKLLPFVLLSETEC